MPRWPKCPFVIVRRMLRVTELLGSPYNNQEAYFNVKKLFVDEKFSYLQRVFNIRGAVLLFSGVVTSRNGVTLRFSQYIYKDPYAFGQVIFYCFPQCYDLLLYLRVKRCFMAIGLFFTAKSTKWMPRPRQKATLSVDIVRERSNSSRRLFVRNKTNDFSGTNVTR